jgi:hypothetical protein
VFFFSIYILVGVSAVAGVLLLLTSLLFLVFPLSLLLLVFLPVADIPGVFSIYTLVGVSAVAGSLLLLT